MKASGQAGFLRIGLIGCGRIAEHHLRFIARTPGARVVAVADPVNANSRRFAQQYSIPKVYASHSQMLSSTPLDVVHILTPPEFHYAQALDAIERGVHVLLEKPCTIQPQQLVDLYERADAKRVRLCPDFIQLFTPVFLRAASLIDSGDLGKVIHLDIHLSIDLNTPDLRESIEVPWRFNLPGGILHDNITHPLYMALHWLGKPNRVTVFPQSRHTLPQGLTDHMSIMLEGNECTANVVISTLIRPEPYYIQVFCERGSVLANFDTSSVIMTRASKLPRSLRRATHNFHQAYQFIASGITNFINFGRGRLLPYQGLENLIPRFYDCVRAACEPPVSKDLAVSVAEAEAQIFSQAGKLHLDATTRPSKQKSLRRPEKILVTGAAGYLGSVVARKLVQEGYYVRALVRALSHTDLLNELGVEVIYGDIRSSDNVLQAAQGMDLIVHAAAALRGSSEFILDSAVKGTKNIVTAAKVCHLRRVIYISSMSVYDYFRLNDGELLSENSLLEEHPELRGTYSLAKRRAEDEAMSHLKDQDCSWTILRPSVIVGNGQNLFSPVGKKIGNFLISPGSAKKILGLVHVEDVARAILNLLQNEATCGRIFNVSDEGISQKEYIQQCILKTGRGNLRVVYIPHWLATLAAATLKSLRLISRRVPDINQRRLASVYRSVNVKSDAIYAKTGWQPRKNLVQSLIAEAHRTNAVGRNDGLEIRDANANPIELPIDSTSSTYLFFL